MAEISYHSLGSLVIVKASFLNEPERVIGLVYEVYKNGISIITQNGVDLGGFSIEEQAKFLEYYGDTGKCYNFKNVTQLHQDWQNGLFRQFFDHPEQFKKYLKF